MSPTKKYLKLFDLTTQPHQSVLLVSLNALEKSLGADALPQMKDMVAKEIDTMMMQCNQMYKNFVKIINN